jgi:preprotein translocase subunit SecE
MLLRIYKPGQGKYTRLGTGLASGVVVALGCLQLYRRMDATDLTLWVKTMIPAGVFVGLCILIYWIINKSSVADFMIAAEGELKKVSWSSRKEIAVSTFIVILVVFLMAIFLGATDISFEMLFSKLLR